MSPNRRLRNGRGTGRSSGHDCQPLTTHPLVKDLNFDSDNRSSKQKRVEGSDD